jgi:hypothetical protein
MIIGKEFYQRVILEKIIVQLADKKRNRLKIKIIKSIILIILINCYLQNHKINITICLQLKLQKLQIVKMTNLDKRVVQK